MITLNRPQAANALSAEMLRRLQLILQEIELTQTSAALSSQAPVKSVLRGADLKERIKLKEDQVLESVSLIQRTAALLESLPRPVIVR